MKSPDTIVAGLSPADVSKNRIVYGLYESERVHAQDGWIPEDKNANFERLLQIEDFTQVPLAGSSVLDVGCGHGDFAPILRQRGVGKYRGIDLLDWSINAARMRYPKERFVQGDFLQASFGEHYDYLFASGTFALALETDNYEAVRTTIRKMFGMAEVGIAFNLIVEPKPHPKPDVLFYYDRERMGAIVGETVGNNPSAVTFSSVGVDRQLTQMNVYAWKKDIAVTR